MPHIHTGHNQHDMTVSAFIIRVDGSQPRVLVHMHRKFGKLMQVGGHIELDETPWQTVAHEVREESGYELAELEVLQPTAGLVEIANAIVHPVPVLMNTHKINDEHYHSDLCYAFAASAPPVHQPADGESEDLRWLTMAELRQAIAQGQAGKDVGVLYATIIDRFLSDYSRLPAAAFSLDKPAAMSI